MRTYYIFLHEDKEDGHMIVFECVAQDCEGAIALAMLAYPNGSIAGVVPNY